MTHERILPAVILTLSLALLIGARFDAIWAGGEGYQEQATFLGIETVTLDGEPANTGLIEITRGEMLETGSYFRQFRSYEFSYPCDIWLDENTQVVVENAQEGETAFSLVTGRVVVNCKATVTAREAKVTFDGTATFVNYSWEHLFVAKLIDGQGEVFHGDETVPFMSSIPVAMDTIDATLPINEGVTFTMEQEPMAAFYAWALSDAPSE